ncbi:MAG: fasciclin domain-containing protein [Dehalococcoidia bacterium]
MQIVNVFRSFFLLAFAMAAVFLMVAACGSEEEVETESASSSNMMAVADSVVEEAMVANTIVDIAVADGRFTTLVTALQAAELDGVLSGDDQFTVFAPTDEAFANLPEGTLESLLADIPALKDILLYHVTSGSVLAADVVTLDSAPTLQGQSVDISVMGSSVMVDQANVIITDIVASNGVIHVIDAVILPEEPVVADPVVEEAVVANTIVDIAVADGRFTTLVTALQAAELDGVLSGDDQFTVFAPTDEAFANLPEGILESLLGDIPALKDILLYHVTSGSVLAADVVALDSAPTLQGQSVDISVMGSSVMVNQANVVITDIIASNGVIHVIDAVISPEEPVVANTIVDIAVADGRFTTLVSALQAAELDGVLSGDDQFTVFAPTDEAFANLPEGTLESLLADIPALKDILLYHVTSGSVLAADVVTLDSAPTLQGQSVDISVMGSSVMVDQANVVITDIIASNGVIHVIDAVILPE